MSWLRKSRSRLYVSFHNPSNVYRYFMCRFGISLAGMNADGSYPIILNIFFLVASGVASFSRRIIMVMFSCYSIPTFCGTYAVPPMNHYPLSAGLHTAAVACCSHTPSDDSARAYVFSYLWFRLIWEVALLSLLILNPNSPFFIFINSHRWTNPQSQHDVLWYRPSVIMPSSDICTYFFAFIFLSLFLARALDCSSWRVRIACNVRRTRTKYGL